MQICSIKVNPTFCLEKTPLGNLPFVLIFVDFLKAVDSINHSITFKILAAYGMPPNILNAIKIKSGSLSAKVI